MRVVTSALPFVDRAQATHALLCCTGSQGCPRPFPRAGRVGKLQCGPIRVCVRIEPLRQQVARSAEQLLRGVPGGEDCWEKSREDHVKAGRLSPG